MLPPTALIRRAPLAAYFLLAFALTWALLPFARTSVPISILALFGPAASALIVAATLGPSASAELRRRTTAWRIPLHWYLVALLFPLPVSALASGLEYLWGAHGSLQFQPISALALVIFVMVIGEEIGWRGFALPRLVERFGPWTGSAVLGAMWALWHLPLFYLVDFHQFGDPFLPFIGYTVGLSIILTVLMQQTGGSVLIATLSHGAVNTFGLVNTAADSALRGWGNAASYGLVALAVGVVVHVRRRVRHPIRRTPRTPRTLWRGHSSTPPTGTPTVT